ncbi:AraC family transcriptional regulator [Oscillatoriales cyanobacterium LEGE 11467]|uniref:AraC family transcriptional regulator n=1 Tax=Zarconia navalis LEGE 11467 TaxID=1828826 RepID=A0A928VY83_9CYAN|nr:AraC family transcriptional regulator [Zarconia navalis]MBE9040982.1 AraC family transcriptional regulator [Zarconia navalis LEGE 11467]
MLESLRNKVRDSLLKNEGGSALHYFSEDVFCIKEVDISELNETLYEPALCLILQGAKQTNLDNRTLRLSAGDSIVISHHVPVYAKITRASVEIPYLSLIIKIDMKIIRSLYFEIEQIVEKQERAFSVDSERADSALIDTLDRFITTIEDPLEAELIGPSLFKELHLRVLRAPQGGMLRQMIPMNSAANNIARSIKHIRNNYRAGLLVAEVAREVGMSESSFYKKFREITGTTPHQYQKTLRLIEAHSLLSLEGYSVSDAAFAVGYESASHFSRDYSKKFGIPPKDAKSIEM